MKKSIKEENTSKQSMISRIMQYQKMYDICFSRINAMLEQQIKETGSNAKTFLPKEFKNKFNKNQ